MMFQLDVYLEWEEKITLSILQFSFSWRSQGSPYNIANIGFGQFDKEVFNFYKKIMME